MTSAAPGAPRAVSAECGLLADTPLSACAGCQHDHDALLGRGPQDPAGPDGALPARHPAGLVAADLRRDIHPDPRDLGALLVPVHEHRGRGAVLGPAHGHRAGDDHASVLQPRRALPTPAHTRPAVGCEQGELAVLRGQRGAVPARRAAHQPLARRRRSGRFHGCRDHSGVDVIP